MATWKEQYGPAKIYEAHFRRRRNQYFERVELSCTNGSAQLWPKFLSRQRVVNRMGGPCAEIQPVDVNFYIVQPDWLSRQGDDG